jgi:multiple sugar transport system permease protein
MSLPPVTEASLRGFSQTRSPRRGAWKEAGLAYLLLAPSALILGAFGFVPLLNALMLSFREWRSVPGGFVGFSNYEKALTADPAFWQSMGVTVQYVLGTVPATIVLGYLLAELLHSRIRGLPFYRTLFFLPYIVSPVAAAAVWRWILDPNVGLANAVAARLGVGHLLVGPLSGEPQWLRESTGIFQLLGNAAHVEMPAWAAGPSLALVCIILVSIWHSVGFAVVVLLAGLAAIPGEVTEAAQIDGARGWSLMRRVKLPLLSPTLFFLLVVFTIRAFQTFTQIYVLSVDNRGGPAGTTRNVTLYIVECFRTLEARLGPGYGSTIAMLLFVVVLTLTLVQFRVLGRKVHYG